MTRIIVAELVQSGLTGTLVYIVRDTTGQMLATGFGTEDGTSAIYRATLQWDYSWSGTISWFNNNIELAVEDFVATLPESVVLELGYDAYITIENAQFYFSRKLNTDAWDTASPDNKAKSLFEATELIDRLNFIGHKVVRQQTLQWPRVIHSNREAVFPIDIQKATAELALALLDGIDPDLEDDLLSSQSDAYATVRVTSDSTLAKDHIKAGIVSITAWRLLLPWLNDPRSIHLRKG